MMNDRAVEKCYTAVSACKKFNHIAWKSRGNRGEASKEDYWKDKNLEAAMREITGITDRDILFSDVWELTELDLDGKQIRDISALSGLTNLTHVSLTGNPIED